MEVTAVRERPILFSGPMVRAILAGLKTQTRRVVDLPAPAYGGRLHVETVETGPPPPFERIFMVDEIGEGGHRPMRWSEDRGAIACPYGQPGDRLWVREAFSFIGEQGVWELRDTLMGGHRWIYRADGDTADRWWPSIHMPRRASRLTLEITDVRVERVQDIGPGDCIEEGVEPREGAPDPSQEDRWLVADFRSLWDSINHARGYGWDANPWVWVVSFRRAEPTR